MNTRVCKKIHETNNNLLCGEITDEVIFKLVYGNEDVFVEEMKKRSIDDEDVLRSIMLTTSEMLIKSRGGLLHGSGYIRATIRRIASNLLTRWIEKSEEEKLDLVDLELGYDVEEEEKQPEEEVGKLVYLLLSAMEKSKYFSYKLMWRDGEIFLYRLSGLSSKEISDIYNITSVSVVYRITRFKENLKAFLNGSDESFTYPDSLTEEKIEIARSWAKRGLKLIKD